MHFFNTSFRKLAYLKENRERDYSRDIIHGDINPQTDLISQLPQELAVYIMSLLKPRDLINVALTCKYWRFLAEDSLIWKNKYSRARDDIVCKCSRLPNTPWKVIYMDYMRHCVEWNWKKEKPIRQKVIKESDVIKCVQMYGDLIVTGSRDNNLKIWSVTTGECLQTLVGHTGSVRCLQMSGNRLVSGSSDTTLKVWDLDTGECIHTLQGHTSKVLCMDIHRTHVVSGCKDAALRIWDIDEGLEINAFFGHKMGICQVKFDGEIVVSCGYDGLIRIWFTTIKRLMHTLLGPTDWQFRVLFEDHNVISGCLDTSIRVWDVYTGICKHSLPNGSLVTALQVSKNILVSGSYHWPIQVWDVNTGQRLTMIGRCQHTVLLLSGIFNNRFIITSTDDHRIKLWEMDEDSGRFVRKLAQLDSDETVWQMCGNSTKLVCAVRGHNEEKLIIFDFNTD